VSNRDRVFLSYSRNDRAAALNLRRQLEGSGLAVFRDDESIHEGDLWLSRLQEAVDGCSGFVVLVGRDGVARWVGAETQAALNRHFGPRDDRERLPIFPVLLDGTRPESLPAFLRLFQATTWNGVDPLPERLLGRIRERAMIVANDAAAFEGCPFVGLDAYRVDQAPLFFGRQKETLDALACFDARPGSPTVRWLEINGNSGSGKSSLLNAGLLPLVDQGWLWPRTRIADWRRIGPMLPGERPVTMLAEQLARRLSARLLTEHGGSAGILSEGADNLLASLGPQRGRALELLFRLVNVDPDGRRHTRRRMAYAEAVAVAGGGKLGRRLIGRLAGERARDGAAGHGPLRLLTVTKETGGDRTASSDGRWVNLIHETLIRAKSPAAHGKPQPYWPTLWNYIAQNKDRAARRERLHLLAREWQGRQGVARLFGLAGWPAFFGFRGLAAPGSIEQRYLRWSRVSVATQAALLTVVVGVVGEALYWKTVNELPLQAVWTRWAYKLGRELPLPQPVDIPAGTFMMGSGSQQRGDEQPVHLVTFTEPFGLSPTEVTFAQYDAFARATGRALPDEWSFGRDEQPVINVDWSEARDYARWLGAMIGRHCRLPSEAEWEYACRARTMTEFGVPAPEGSDDIGSKGLANCNGCGSKWDNRRTAPVRQFPANAWGLYDMHGNVWEWVEDCWHDDYENAPPGGQPWLNGNGGDCRIRVLRGGSWLNFPSGTRCASRNQSWSYSREGASGFRVVCSSPSSDP
jgi:formylglycine-generating enzyme required for sulfatase activity